MNLIVVSFSYRQGGLRAILSWIITVAILISASPAQDIPIQDAKLSPEQLLERLRSEYRAQYGVTLESQRTAYLKRLEALEQRGATKGDSYAAAAARQERETPELGFTPLKIPSGQTSPLLAELQTLRSEFEKSRDTALVSLNMLFAGQLQRMEQNLLATGEPMTAALAKTEREALLQPPLKIIHADYGRKGRYINVTDKIRKAMVFNRIEIPCENSLGGNPRPHVQKQAVIRFQVGNGPVQSAFFEQSTLIKLPRPQDLAKAVLVPATPPMPKTVARSEPKSASATVIPTPSPHGERTIILAPGWDGKFQGGKLTIEDLATLFHGRGMPSTNMAGDPSILVFENVPYLTPIEEAKELLRLTGNLPSKMQVSCPGLPRGSLYYYAFDGNFEGQFNRLYLVTDRAEQVVSAQLVDETPRAGRLPTDRSGRHTYNFINHRVKSLNTLLIDHKITQPRPKVLALDTVLISSGSNGAASGGSLGDQREARILEQSRWYVPQPLVNLILRCTEQR